MGDKLENRRNAAERAGYGAVVFGAGAGAKFLNDNRFKPGKKPTILRAIKNKSFSGTHARYLGAKAAARSVQGAGATVAILGAKQVVSGKKNEKFHIGHEVVKPLVGADKIEEKVSEHMSKAKDDDPLIRSKQRTRRFAQAGGVIGGTALVLRAPELATAASRNSKSTIIRRAQKMEPKATRVSNTLLAGGAGIGAAGAFNSAHMQKLETNRLKQNRLSAVDKASKLKTGDKHEKQKLAAVGGAGVVAGVTFPTRQSLPDDFGASDRVHNQLSGKTSGKVKTADIRGIAVGEGHRFGNDTHTARVAQSIRTHGFDEKRPIEVVRYRNGKMKVVGGHHRLRAAEMLGRHDVPVKISNETGNAPKSIVPMYKTSRYVRNVVRNRQPNKSMSHSDIDSLAGKHIPSWQQKFNNAKSRSEEIARAASTPRNKAIIAGTAAAGTAAYGSHKLSAKGKVSKRDDKFLAQYRDRISPSAEEGYKYLKSGERSRRFDAAGNAALGAGLIGHAGHLAGKKRFGIAGLEGLGGAIALKTAADSHNEARSWNAKRSKIKAAAIQREAEGVWGKNRNVDVAKSLWVKKGLSVGLHYPKGTIRRPGIRAGHLMRTASGKTVTVRGSVG